VRTALTTTTRARVAGSDEAVIAFAVSGREPDRDVPSAALAYGKRYMAPTATSSTPAIVLVHGIASSTAN
jgi:poly(3-hydroxybutyrate) depolymerase